MSRPTLYARGLDVFVAAGRLSPLLWLAVGLAMGTAVAQVWWLGDLRAQRVEAASRLQALRRTGTRPGTTPVIPMSPSANRLQDFEAALGGRDHPEELIRAMFASARQAGLVLAEGEYAGAPDKSGLYLTWEVSQPVHGTYEQVRGFCERTLLSMPFAALDSLQFKRDGVATEVGEAKVRWTFYLRPPEAAASVPRGAP